MNGPRALRHQIAAQLSSRLPHYSGLLRTLWALPPADPQLDLLPMPVTNPVVYPYEPPAMGNDARSPYGSESLIGVGWTGRPRALRQNTDENGMPYYDVVYSAMVYTFVKARLWPEALDCRDNVLTALWHTLLTEPQLGQPGVLLLDENTLRDVPTPVQQISGGRHICGAGTAFSVRAREYLEFPQPAALGTVTSVEVTETLLPHPALG